MTTLNNMSKEQRQAAFNKDWEASGGWPKVGDYPLHLYRKGDPGTREMPTSVVSVGYKVIMADVPVGDSERGGWPVVGLQVDGVDSPEIDQVTADYIRAHFNFILDCSLAYHMGGMGLLASELS